MMAENPSATETSPSHPLPRVTIQFCTQCKWMLRAAYFAQELLSTFSTSLGEVALQPTTGGIFTVAITHAPPTEAGQNRSHLLWDRRSEGGFPETKELKRRVRDVIEPGRDLGHVDRDRRHSQQKDSTTTMPDTKPEPSPTEEASTSKPPPAPSSFPTLSQLGAQPPPVRAPPARTLGGVPSKQIKPPAEDSARVNAAIEERNRLKAAMLAGTGIGAVPPESLSGAAAGSVQEGVTAKQDGEGDDEDDEEGEGGAKTCLPGGHGHGGQGDKCEDCE